MKHFTDLVTLAKKKGFETRYLHRWFGDGDIVIIEDFYIGYLVDEDSGSFGGWTFAVLAEDGYDELYNDGWTKESAQNKFPSINHEDLIKFVNELDELPVSVKEKFKSIFE